MTPLTAKEITVTLPQLPSLFPSSTAEDKFKAAVYWAVERHYPEAGFVFVRWDSAVTSPQAEVNEGTAGPEVDQVVQLVLQLQDLWLLAFESVRDYLDSQLTWTRRVLRPECSCCGQACREANLGGNSPLCEPCRAARGQGR